MSVSRSGLRRTVPVLAAFVVGAVVYFACVQIGLQSAVVPLPDAATAAAGEAKVESKRGAMEIEVEFSGLDKPTAFGNEYLTYVLWAISPEGRAVNIGEVEAGPRPEVAA